MPLWVSEFYEIGSFYERQSETASALADVVLNPITTRPAVTIERLESLRQKGQAR